MIDRKGRMHTAELLRHLAAGLITNDKFEDALPTSHDPAVNAIQRQAWFLYGDLREYKLRGEHALSRDAKEAVARSIVFLYSPLPYEWPPFPLRGILRLAATLITVGILPRILDNQWKSAGDFEVWPFIRRADFESAKSQPRLLTGY